MKTENSRRYRAVMPALVAGIHVFAAFSLSKGVGGRDKPGHDDRERFANIL
jgi:hypothetical protein